MQNSGHGGILIGAGSCPENTRYVLAATGGNRHPDARLPRDRRGGGDFVGIEGASHDAEAVERTVLILYVHISAVLPRPERESKDIAVGGLEDLRGVRSIEVTHGI